MNPDAEETARYPANRCFGFWAKRKSTARSARCLRC